MALAVLVLVVFLAVLGALVLSPRHARVRRAFFRQGVTPGKALGLICLAFGLLGVLLWAVD
ncbi:hypothetical protein GCM10023201_50350 [Actinomycetospora corticicola]